MFKKFDKLDIEKHFINNTIILPAQGKERYKVLDINNNEYCLDYEKGMSGNINIKVAYDKQKGQMRFGSEVIIRVDINSPPHMTSTGEIKSRNHVHVFYPEGTEVYEISELVGYFKDMSAAEVFSDICRICNIEQNFTIQTVL